MTFLLPTRPIKEYSQKEDQKYVDHLRKMYGYKKFIPKDIELQALRALAHYPELLKVEIHFVFKELPVAHESRPVPGTLIFSPSGRSYEVIISNKLKRSIQKTGFFELSYNAQIGVLCHELAHTSEYVRKSNWWILTLGIRYILPPFEKFKHHFENLTDMRAINHGAGHQLLAWSETVHDILVRDGRGDNYLSPEQIKKVMNEHILYQ